MSTGDGTPYRDTQIRHLTGDEQRRGMAAIDELETAWFMDPERVEDLQRLHLVRMQVRSGRVALGELGWLKGRLGE